MEPEWRSSRRWVRWLLGVLIGLALLVLTSVGVLMVFEWRPGPIMDTPVQAGGSSTEGPLSRLELLSWNIGYAGLGRDADFFMDGGEQVRPPDASVVGENLSAICGYLQKHPADVVLLQEVDSQASRSFGINQVEAVAGVLPNHFRARALNFKVPWIPYPLLRPIGRVESGLLSLTRNRPGRAVRHQLPGSHPWPVRVFHLKRCLHELRLPAADGRLWVILHLHLSVFDAGGRMRRQQMAYLRELILRLYREGHHVIAGGDWNQAFPGLDERSFPHTAETPDWFQKVPPDWTPPGWQWAFDRSVPSLRATNRPYAAGQNFVTTVDGFLVDPDTRVVSVQAKDLGFTHTDHHPVRLQVALPRWTLLDNPTE